MRPWQDQHSVHQPTLQRRLPPRLTMYRDKGPLETAPTYAERWRWWLDTIHYCWADRIVKSHMCSHHIRVLAWDLRWRRDVDELRLVKIINCCLTYASLWIWRLEGVDIVNERLLRRDLKIANDRVALATQEDQVGVRIVEREHDSIWCVQIDHNDGLWESVGRTETVLSFRWAVEAAKWCQCYVFNAHIICTKQ